MQKREAEGLTWFTEGQGLVDLLVILASAVAIAWLLITDRDSPEAGYRGRVWLDLLTGVWLGSQGPMIEAACHPDEVYCIVRVEILESVPWLLW